MSRTAPILSSRRWPEHELIEKEYPRRGRHWVAEKIGRSPDVVHNYARRHGLEAILERADRELDIDTSYQREEADQT